MKSYLRMDYQKFNSDNLKKILSQFNHLRKVKILFISTYNPEYPRTTEILDILDKNKIKHKDILVGKSKLKYFKSIYYLIKYQKDYDVIFVSFRGHEILPFIKLFSKKPIIFDIFVSIYDTLCHDRKVFSPNSILGKLLKWYDTYLCKISEIVLVDTKTHKEYFEREFNAKNSNFIYMDADTKLFKPLRNKPNKKIFTVFWYGYANPLQGVDIILKAAKLLENNKKIRFKLGGPIREKYSELIDSLKLVNVEFVDFIPYRQLPIEINRADLCLGGHFSDIQKAKRVIAGKTFQFLACDKPTILSNTAANRELFRERGLIHFVKENNERLLANKILEILG